MKFNKLAKILIGVFAVTAFCIPNTVNAKTLTNKDGESKKIIFKAKEDTNKTKLFNKAKSNNAVVEKDENGNIIYKTTQQLQVYEDQEGQKFENLAVTYFQKIDDPLNLSTRSSSSKGDGSWDSSKSAYLSSTVYYTKTTYNNRDCVKLDNVSGEVSNLNSGVKLYSLQVTMISEGMGVTNQSKTTSCSSSFNLSAPSSWVPVPAVFGQWGSLVGCKMKATLGRSSSSTWAYEFVNKL